MAQPSITNIENVNLHFQGFARVRLASLKFSYALAAEHRPVSEQNVARLHRIFRVEGCKRIDEKHFVTALVRREQLDGIVPGRGRCLRNVPPANWSDVPLLDVESIECLNGIHEMSK